MSNRENKNMLDELMTKYFIDTKIENVSTVYVITHGKETLVGSVPSSTHMEADYRLVGQILHAIRCGYNCTTVRANDTDILMILMAFMSCVLEK